MSSVLDRLRSSIEKANGDIGATDGLSVQPAKRAAVNRVSPISIRQKTLESSTADQVVKLDPYVGFSKDGKPFEKVRNTAIHPFVRIMYSTLSHLPFLHPTAIDTASIPPRTKDIYIHRRSFSPRSFPDTENPQLHP